MKCKFIKPNNEKCKANAMSCGLCFTHNPATAQEKKDAVLKGGLAPKTRYLSQMKFLKIKSPSDSLVVLEEAINGIRKRSLSADEGNCIGYLVALYYRGLDAKKKQDPFSLLREK